LPFGNGRVETPSGPAASWGRAGALTTMAIAAAAAIGLRPFFRAPLPSMRLDDVAPLDDRSARCRVFS